MQRFKRDDSSLSDDQRLQLLDELQRRYPIGSSLRGNLFFFWKKYAWIAIVELTKATKRFIDLIGSLFFICLFSPFLILISLAIKLYDGGPIIYSTPRVGKWGEEFSFPKFRSMEIDADQRKASLQKENIHNQEKIFKLRSDPRVTPLGKYLRKFSLDELPQLWSVFKGKMSLVGPRPPLPEEVKHYSLKERERLNIKPGLTCLWQINGRSEIPFNEQVQLDVEYIESQSFWGDILILLKTIPAVLLGRGAY